ncbi:hypothetical protein EMCRGX_G016364 [Ephydatia muelleri]|eukprot:Em0008g908a
MAGTKTVVLLLAAWFATVITAQSDFSVRLAGGGNSTGSEQYLGRVEVFINGQWGTVCSLGWTIEDALVVCRMLGFPSASRAVNNGIYGLGTGPVWLSNLNCRGNESSLAMCQYAGLNNTGCTHLQDAGVVCSDDLAVRLVNGTSPDNGRVEVYHSNQWGTVCSDFWTFSNALVVCRQLGYPTALEAVVLATRYGQGTGPIWLDDVQCTGSEPSLSLCLHRPFGTHNCQHWEDAGVRCAPANFTAPVLPIRLNNGSTHSIATPSLYYGRVEIFVNGSWGTVCDDNWGIQDGQVVCRQLRQVDSDVPAMYSNLTISQINVFTNDFTTAIGLSLDKIFEDSSDMLVTPAI